MNPFYDKVEYLDVQPLPSNWFAYMYKENEKRLIEISKYVPIKNDFEAPEYQFCSIKISEFCGYVGQFVETLFEKILMKTDMLDHLVGIEEKRKKEFGRNWDIYCDYIITPLNLEDAELFISGFEDMSIFPFRNCNMEYGVVDQKSYWFRKYSRYKHNHEKLYHVWRLRDCLFSLGCAYILTHFCLSKTYENLNATYDQIMDYLTGVFLHRDFNFQGPTWHRIYSEYVKWKDKQNTEE